MMKFNHAVFFFFLLPAFICEAQSLKPNREKVMKAQAELRGDIGSFQICLNESDLQPCMTTLIAKADNPYKKYLAGGILFSIDPGKSLQLHKEAYEADRKDANFALEYALELHRARKYAEAIPLYLAYQESNPDDFRLSVWLSDCYLNTGAVDKSIEYWRMSNHPSNHTGIDFAIHIIYGETNQVSRRDRYRKEINNGNLKAFYPLIFLDLNWAYDWWNAETLDPFLQADLALMKNKACTE